VHESFLFGPPGQQLFATYHPPSGGGRGDLVVICPPLFAEYLRTHPALRELAVRLAEEGRHVLRLDYRGTGDSSCELADVTVSDWVEDIVRAVDEGRDISGSTVVRVLAVRAAGLLACRAVGSSPDVHQLVLWDPVLDGAGYLESLRRIQRHIIERSHSLSRALRREAMRDYSGYALSDRMVDDWGKLALTDITNVSRQRLQVVTSSTTGFERLDGITPQVERFECNWETEGEDLMMPQPVLELLLTCLTER
jgi:pimeloyl-ACP methyl ester carboxylesterase